MKKIDGNLQQKLNKKEWTIAENSEPRLEVLVTRPRMAITDSNYFTTEIIRELPFLEDIAVAPRRMSLQEYPDKLFDIHIHNGMVKTATRDYPDEYEKGWRDGIEIERGKRVGIAFNGKWERYENRWILITERTPHLFWTDNTHALKTQSWEDGTTRLDLASDVKEFSVIRAWKSVAVKEDDNGVLVVYIKADNKLYYRTLAENAEGKTVWEPEREIETEYTPKTINLFLTNDYRTGLIIEDMQGKIHYKITDRNWAGMGIPAENISVICEPTIKFTKINKIKKAISENIGVKGKITCKVLYAGTKNKILSANNTDSSGNFGTKILILSEREIYNSTSEDWAIVDSEGTIKEGVSYASIDGLKHTVEFEDFNNFVGDVMVKYKSKIGTNIFGEKYPEMNYSFTPQGLVPFELPPPTAINSGEYDIIVTFPYPVNFNPKDYIAGLKITSIGYEDTRRISFVDDTHVVESASLEDNVLTITLTPETRMKRAKEVVVLYQSVVPGTMGYKATFTPEGYDLTLNPYIAENIKLDTSIDVSLQFIEKTRKECEESLNTNVTVAVELTNINGLNP